MLFRGTYRALNNNCLFCCEVGTLAAVQFFCWSFESNCASGHLALLHQHGVNVSLQSALVAGHSVPQAINCVLQASSFEDALRSAVSIGGDGDTIAAIAGGIAEAMFGLREEIAGTTWKYLPEDMQGVVNDFYRAKSP
jgi:hypothetical protein